MVVGSAPAMIGCCLVKVKIHAIVSSGRALANKVVHSLNYKPRQVTSSDSAVALLRLRPCIV